jgi:hypothetical protein
MLAMCADDAAKTAALEVWRGNAANYAAFAQHAIDDAVTAGQIPSATPTIRLCSDAGATCLPVFSTNKYVEVILATTHSTFLGSVLGIATLSPTARAVAGSSSSVNCLITLTGGMAQSNPVGSVTAEDCSVAVAGNFDVRGSLDADSISAGSCSNGCGPVTIGPPPSDPLIGLSMPTAADCNSGSPGGNVNLNGANVSLTHGTYNNITFKGNHDVLTLGPGVYCLTGLLSASAPGKDINIDASSGVLIYITPTGTFQADSNNIDIELTAQTTGPWAGITMVQDRSNHNDVTFGKNNGDLELDGAIYVPGATIRAKNANLASSHLCGILVAAAIDWEKPDFNVVNECGTFGGSPLTSVALAE